MCLQFMTWVWGHQEALLILDTTVDACDSQAERLMQIKFADSMRAEAAILKGTCWFEDTKATEMMPTLDA